MNALRIRKCLWKYAPLFKDLGIRKMTIDRDQKGRTPEEALGSAFALMDTIDDLLRRGKVEQAQRYLQSVQFALLNYTEFLSENDIRDDNGEQEEEKRFRGKNIHENTVLKDLKRKLIEAYRLGNPKRIREIERKENEERKRFKRNVIDEAIRQCRSNTGAPPQEAASPFAEIAANYL